MKTGRNNPCPCGKKRKSTRNVVALMSPESSLAGVAGKDGDRMGRLYDAVQDGYSLWPDAETVCSR